MRPLSALNKKDIENIKLVCFDVDGVTIKKGTEIEEKKSEEKTTLTVTTHNLDLKVKEKILKLKEYFIIAINSGRSSMYLTTVFTEILWDNVALISENGIFTLLTGKLVQLETFDEETLVIMRNIVNDLKKLEGIEKDFRAFEPKQFLITLHAYSDIPEVHNIVRKHDVNSDFSVLWNGEAFDIAPKRLNKGRALKNLSDYLKIDINDTMAIANGPNDKTMVDVAGIGVTTEPKELEADFHTTGDQHLGGEELIDKLLELKS